jgi:subtilisin family serine protease
VAARGVVPDAEIVAIKVLDKAASGSSTNLLSALDYLITRRPEVKVVNLSLGFAELYPGSCDTADATTLALASSIGTLRARGTIVFASTGNGGSRSAIAAPACVSSVVAVGGVYVADTGSVSGGCTDATTTADQVFCFSNSSSAVDILAPGGPITAAAPGGGTATLIGTSMAVPHAAGAAAILIEANPGLTPARIETALKGTGPVITDAKNGMQFHRVDVKAAADASR